jgi:transcriptional regulator with XRE-family HTH domain
MAQDRHIAGLVKKRREELGLSLREVGRRAGLTAAFISQVERGKSNTSIDSLRRIADALDVSLLYFLSNHRSSADPEVPPERGTSVFVVRSDCRPRLTLPDSRVSYELLVPDLTRQTEVIRGCLPPGSGNVARRLKAPTEECIYVVSGSLLVEVEGQTVVLHAGDNIFFSGRGLTRLECASKDEDAVWISVITPPVF